MEKHLSTKLPRSRRLTDTRVFRGVFAGGASWRGNLVVMWASVSDGAGALGVVASKKTFPKAHLRSRAKRLMREAYRLNRFRLKDGVNIILVGRRSITDASRQDVEEDLLRLAGLAGLLADIQ